MDNDEKLLKQMDPKASIISDDELGSVAGGEDEEMVQCPRCGSWFGNMSSCCPTCKYAG